MRGDGRRMGVNTGTFPLANSSFNGLPGVSGHSFAPSLVVWSF